MQPLSCPAAHVGPQGALTVFHHLPRCRLPFFRGRLSTFETRTSRAKAFGHAAVCLQQFAGFEKTIALASHHISNHILPLTVGTRSAQPAYAAVCTGLNAEAVAAATKGAWPRPLTAGSAGHAAQRRVALGQGQQISFRSRRLNVNHRPVCFQLFSVLGPKAAEQQNSRHRNRTDQTD